MTWLKHAGMPLPSQTSMDPPLEGSDSGKEESAKSNAALTGEAVVDSLTALIGSKKTTGAKRSSGDDELKGTKKSKK